MPFIFVVVTAVPVIHFELGQILEILLKQRWYSQPFPERLNQEGCQLSVTLRCSHMNQEHTGHSSGMGFPWRGNKWGCVGVVLNLFPLLICSLIMCVCMLSVPVWDYSTGRVGGPLVCCEIKLKDWLEGEWDWERSNTHTNTNTFLGLPIHRPSVISQPAQTVSTSVEITEARS